MNEKRDFSRCKKYIPGLVLFCALAGLALFLILAGNPAGHILHSSPPATPASWSEYDPLLATMAGQVNESELYRTTKDLQNFSTRQYPSPGNEQAARYLADRLSAIPGLQVTFQDSMKKNVLATLPGTEPAPGSLVIVGAHYDSASSDPDHAPGATDNACGAAIVLELARVMSTHPYNRTIVFAFWNNEETPHSRGSMDYVTSAREHSLDIPLYVNYDSACYDPASQGVLDIMYDKQSEPYAEVLAGYNTLYSVNLTLTRNEYSCDGDQMSFREGGYPSLMTHAGLHADEAHTPNDTIDLVSPGFAGKNARLGMLVLSRAAGIRQ